MKHTGKFLVPVYWRGDIPIFFAEMEGTDEEFEKYLVGWKKENQFG